MEPIDIVGKTKEDASLPKGLFQNCSLILIFMLSFVVSSVIFSFCVRRSVG